MRGILVLLLTLALGLFACNQQSASTGAGLAMQGLQVKKDLDRYLVVFKGESLPSGAGAQAEREGARVLKSLEPIGTLVVVANQATADRLARLPGVMAVGKEHRYGLPKTERVLLEDTYGSPTIKDALYKYQWDIRRIKAPEVWKRVPLEV